MGVAFELIDIGLKLRLDANQDPLTVGGGVRLVKAPPILENAIALPGPALRLGSAGTSIYIEITSTPDPQGRTPPLVQLPLGGGESLDIVVHALRFGYSWEPPAFEFGLVSDIEVPDLDFSGGVGVLLPPATPTAPSAAMALELKLASPPLPPAPMIEWDLSFGAVATDPDVRGLEVVMGSSEVDRWLTLYLRRTVFNPSLFLMRPGMVLDWGVFLGPAPEDRDLKDFYMDFRMGGGTLITVEPILGAILNPLTLVPPFVWPMPPIWISPPFLMGDLFTDINGMKCAVNIPGLFGFDAKFVRPLPQLSIPMLLEVALLVGRKFEVEIPSDSPLRNLFYVSLEGGLWLSLMREFFGEDAANLHTGVEFNIVEILNTGIRVWRDVRALWEQCQPLSEPRHSTS